MQNFKEIQRKVVVLGLTFFSFTQLYSYHNGATTTNAKSGEDNPTPAAGCAAAVAKATLELNGVRALLEGTGGSMFQDRANGGPAYEVPAKKDPTDPGPVFTSIFAGALWMGGQDEQGNVKLAAVTFRQAGNDFWPGPLSEITADVSEETCTKYDRFFGVSKAMIENFVGYNIAKEEGTADELYPGYSIPKGILEWPGNGNLANGEDQFLAPFFEPGIGGNEPNGIYEPDLGDYPWYDLTGELDCRTSRDVPLFGDTTIWYVFNDKGNTHSETGSPSIGLEVRGQAFAFATNDEVNNMTFYNYEIVNRSSFTLNNTYFGQWIDADLGGANDDFVGCDAERGLGYCYNGQAVDVSFRGAEGYGATPPAVGVDFFEGPFQDDDFELNADGTIKKDSNGDPIGLDNPLTTNVQNALDSGGIPYKGLGIGYGDGIPNNERYGMRKFVYYNNASGPDGDPVTTLDYYGYLQGIWKDGLQQTFGANARTGTIPADLMFPGDSDPLFWSTAGEDPGDDNWTESGAGNTPGDRRFLQSAGPFTLKPGARNNITVGVVWARATSGDNLASIDKLREADDKAQTLFDNCFKVVEGPDAPDLTFQEMDRELILYLSNRLVSNNWKEEYAEREPSIVIPDTIDGEPVSESEKEELQVYKFQGYQIFQVKNSTVSVTDLYNPDLSRLAQQVDIKDGVKQLVNYTFDASLGSGANVPQEMVNGKDEGIQHSFRITTDLFATGIDQRLVNHKRYYYIAIAYGYNQFKEYDPLDPLALDGQTLPYLASRKMAGGSGITPFSAVPHDPTPEREGTVINAQYGDMPLITRIEGQGNGGNNLAFTAESEEKIVADRFMSSPTYQRGAGPISVQVVDPLAVKEGTYTVKFQDSTGGSLDDAYWILTTPSGTEISSDQSIELENEQLILDEGISISIRQVDLPGVNTDLGSGVLTASIEYEDSTKRWLTGVSDLDAPSDQNWIRSGVNTYTPDTDEEFYDDYTDVDPNQDFEQILNGTWAPYRLVSTVKVNDDGDVVVADAPGFESQTGDAYKRNNMSNTPSVDIVFTNDKSKWSRSVVLEARNDEVLAEGGAGHMRVRNAPSVDKAGRKAGDSGYNSGEGDLVSTTGMGWFPGYAINLETGRRLNIAFAEDSWLSAENGKDMQWNPTSSNFAGRWGGKHYVYVFREESVLGTYFPNYDNCSKIFENLTKGTGIQGTIATESTFRTCAWVGIPILEIDHSLGEYNASSGRFELDFETTARVKLRVERPYALYKTDSDVNDRLPMYNFTMEGLKVFVAQEVAQDSTLEIINVVPNPYYAYSEYESDKLDNRIKITNLPEECNVSIYNVSGTLMRRFEKSDPTTSLEWDLKNHADIPVAGGLYLIHVEIPNVGDRVLKWFGVMKPTDLNGL